MSTSSGEPVPSIIDRSAKGPSSEIVDPSVSDDTRIVPSDGPSPVSGSRPSSVVRATRVWSRSVQRL